MHDFSLSAIPEEKLFIADRKKDLPTIREITDLQGIYRNAPVIAWKKEQQEVQSQKGPGQDRIWGLRNSSMRR